MQLRSAKRRRVGANDISPYIPQWWAMETLAILYENMVAARLVNRDFEKYFNKYGDVVNTRRPREFEGLRKVKGDAVTTQDAIADNIQVKLDQWCHVSFVIDDADNTMSMKTLRDEFATPAGQALARMVDRIVLGQYPRFLETSAGSLGGLYDDDEEGKNAIIDLKTAMDENNAPELGRNLILGSRTEGDLLKSTWFIAADRTGDGGDALKNATIGHKLGFNFYKDQNVANVSAGNTTRTGAINNAGGYGIGVTALTVDGITGAVANGSWIELGGYPYQVISSTGGATPTALTLASGLKKAVADNAVITLYTPGGVNNASGYAAGYNKPIAVDGFSVAPRVGQFVTFGSSTDRDERYTVIKASTTSITLDRSLKSAIADNDAVNLGPAGAYNPCFRKDAITLAIRPLAPVADKAGALSQTINWNGLSMRVTISYDATIQQHRWTFDFLAGIQVLDHDQGGVLLG